MNFEFSEEQNLLREQARGFLTEHCSMNVVRNALDSGSPFNQSLWQKIAEMGWTAAVIPEKYDGLGLSYLELCIIADELGRALAPLPFSSSVYLATEAILAYGTADQKERLLPRLASGELIGTFALSEQPGEPSPRSLNTQGTMKLTGTKLAVPDGDVAHICIVVTKSDSGDGANLFIVDLAQPEVVKETVTTLDPTRSHATLTFNEAPAELLGKVGEGWAATQRLLNRAAVLYAWEQTGGADAAMEMGRSYALERYAFGRPIASYQAIKHKLATIYVNNTLARSNCYYGAWALNSSAPELPLAAATARVSAIKAYYYAAKENIQIHGGMGFTWEFDCQFMYRRSKLLAMTISGEARWQDKLVTALENRIAA